MFVLGHAFEMDDYEACFLGVVVRPILSLRILRNPTYVRTSSTWVCPARFKSDLRLNVVVIRSYLLAVLQDLDLVGPARGLVVEVGGPLPGRGHVLVVVESAEAVTLLLRANHGHLRVVVRGFRELKKEKQKITPMLILDSKINFLCNIYYVEVALLSSFITCGQGNGMKHACFPGL